MAENIPGNSSNSLWNENLFIDGQGSFSNLFCSEFMADMTFVIGKERKKVPGHKLVLSMCSWEFYNALNQIKLDQNELPVDDTTFEAFIHFLKCCYGGKVLLTSGDTLDILKLAQRFHMKQLAEICEDHLCKIDNPVTWMKLFSKSAFLDQNSRLKVKILTIAKANFNLFIGDEATMELLMDLSIDSLREIILLENFECDEKKLIDFLMEWADQKYQKANVSYASRSLRVILRDVFDKIQTSIMKIEYFHEVLAKFPQTFTYKEISDIAFRMKNDVEKKKTVCSIMRIPTNIMAEVRGLIDCLGPELKVESRMTKEASVEICCDLPVKVIGCVFFSHKNQKINILSFYYDSDKIQTSINRKMSLGKYYDLVFVHFETELVLNPGIWSRFHAILDKKVPTITTDFLEPVPLSTDKYYFRRYPYIRNIIPYIIIEGNGV